ncbi:MAG: nucleotide exchange factor GrpE [Gemmatimonadales bacterium]
MTKKKPPEPANTPEAPEASEPPVADAQAEAGAPSAEAVPPAFPEAAAESEELRAELEELRDKHLRLAAEYDNYRKRVLRERSEMRARVRAELVETVLEALDDLGRVLDVDVASARAEDLIGGVELVERKLLKELENSGLVRIGAEGERFDPNHHEAMGAEPATEPEQEGLIASVLQPGYRIGTVLVRPARVRVFVAPPQGDGADSEA